MLVIDNSKQNEERIFPIIKDKQSKINEKEISKKTTKIKREKEKNKKTKEKFKNIYFNEKKNVKLKDSLNAEIIIQNEKIFKNCESDVKYYRTDYKNKKISEKTEKNSEKNPISKFAEISNNKIEIKMMREFCYIYGGCKNIKEKNNRNDHKEKYIYQEEENKNYSSRKKNKLNKNKLYGNDYINNYIENNKYNFKLNKIFNICIYNIILKIIFFSQFQKSN